MISPIFILGEDIMTLSRRKVKTVTSNTGIVVEKIYCRKCREHKRPSEFFNSVDDLDSNGYFSICKSCCNTLYDNYFRVEHSIAKAILRTCRKINLMFDEGCVESTEIHLKTMSDNGKPTDNIIGIYKSKLIQSQKSNFHNSDGEFDLTFHEIGISLPPNNPLEMTDENYDLSQIWGDDLEFEDYQYLEKEFAEWQKTHRCDTKAEKTLIREICHKMLEIRKTRKETKGTVPAHLTKELQDLMKTASLDPSKSSAANSGNAKETYSNFIKMIEENEPADFYKDKKLYKDFDGIDFYFRKYVTRPLKNFITQSRDFNVDIEEDVDETVEMEPNENGNIT
jgi:hypothetical protein